MSLYFSIYDDGPPSPPPPRLGGELYDDYYGDNSTTNSTNTTTDDYNGIPNNEAFILWSGFFCMFLLFFFVFWYLGGGRVELQRNEQGRIRNVRVVPPPSSNDCLTTRQVLDLPIIIFEPPPLPVSPSSPAEVPLKMKVIPSDDEEEADLDDIDLSNNTECTYDIHDDEEGGVKTKAEARFESSSNLSASNECAACGQTSAATTTEEDDSSCGCKYTTCPICIEDFTKGEELRVLPRCGHMMHTECVLPWLTQKHGLCPMCKRPVIVNTPPTTLAQHCENLQEREREEQQEMARRRQWRLSRMGRQQNQQRRLQQQPQRLRLYRAANSDTAAAVSNNNDIEQQQDGGGRHYHLDHHRSVTSISDVDIDPTIIVFRNSTRNGIIFSPSNHDHGRHHSDDLDGEEMERSHVLANLEGHVTRLGLEVPREAGFEERPPAVAAGRERTTTLPL